MRRVTISIAFQLAAILYGFAAVPEAHADYKICNHRTDTIFYAYTFWDSGCPDCGGDTGRYRDVGWFSAKPGQCTSVWHGSLPDGYWYYTAFSTTGAKWVGPWAWYVSDDARNKCECLGDGLGQSCADVNTCIPDAEWRGHREQYFINIDNYTFNFN